MFGGGCSRATRPPQPADIGMVDTVSDQLVSLSGHSTTGNHFVFDAVAGLVVTAAGFAVGNLRVSLPRRTALNPA